ncbi:helix-turn-helix domain-containing protein [Nocardioides sp.]|uniref:helix-turn-helix domain-containing protein n=1 Tax=Nocardioides sp. TaxID=35761 RepID=UPI0039E2281D
MPDREPPASYIRAAARLGQLVRSRREQLGWTQERLAEAAGMSRNQIQNIENNRNNTKDPQTGKPGPGNARLETIFLLAEALDVSVHDLIDPGD